MKTMTLVMRVSPGLGALVPAEEVSLLLGVPIEEVHARTRGEHGLANMQLPNKWVRQGRRRASEARASTGKDDVVSVLRYWAEQEHGAELEIQYAPAGDNS